jgi:phosphatidylglycerol:prolipoprotein diacylglycerol transferase
MIPELFKIGPFTVYSYGLMLGIAFITASYLLAKEFEKKGLGENLANQITLIAIICGIAGAKLLYVFEHFDRFLENPLGELFSPGGLTFHGGLILTIIVIYIFLKRKSIPFLYVADAASPALALAYGIGRIGCHLSGDGDYGIPTDLPWGVDYSKGIVPPSVAFRGTDIAENFPNGIVPDDTPLHPTPVYEFLGALLIFFVLTRLSKKQMPDGKLFMFYLILTGLARFLVEFIRINPRVILGLSQAQIISLVSMIIGLYGLYYYSKNSNLPKFNPSVLNIKNSSSPNNKNKKKEKA